MQPQSEVNCPNLLVPRNIGFDAEGLNGTSVCTKAQPKSVYGILSIVFVKKYQSNASSTSKIISYDSDHIPMHTHRFGDRIVLFQNNIKIVQLICV
jgi:hypothetical protein